VGCPVPFNLRRKDEGLQLAEEKIEPDEEESLNNIIDLMADQMRSRFNPAVMNAAVIPKRTVFCMPRYHSR